MQDLKIDKTNKNLNYTTLLYSFDIFDTLVTRTTATPCGIFSIMEKHLQKDCKYINFPEIVKQNFFIIRQEAENFIRANKKTMINAQDIRFEEIYKIIKDNYNLSEEQITILMNLELDTEIKNIVPIQKNINILKELISTGNRVILISDMYHNEKTIRKILSHIDTIFEKIPIYVSSEFEKTKASGDLYKYVQEIEKIDFKNWTHYGDNKFSDINKAKDLGIKTIFTPQKGLKGYEKGLLLNSRISENNFYSQSLIGTAKLTRTLSNSNDKIYDFGCSFTGPLLYNYVQWIIEQSISRGIKTLYFIARDGYVTKLIADEIIKFKNLDIKTKYIYGSRAAWRIITTNTVNTCLKWIFNEYNTMFTLDLLAQRLNISIDELKIYIGSNNYSNKTLKKEEIEKLENILTNNTEFINKLLIINSEKAKITLDYFKQEFKDSNELIGFVDLYGTGRTQDWLSEFISDIYNKPITTFYFFKCTKHEPQNEKAKRLCYLASHKYEYFGIELLCRNIDGQTIGYKKEDDKIIPVIEKINSKNLINWGYYSYIKGILDFTKNVCIIEDLNQISLNSYEIVKHYFGFFKYNLDKETADIFGSIPYKMVGDEQNLTEGAPEYTSKDYLKMFIFGNKNYNIGMDYISRKRSDKKFTKLYEFNRKHENVIKFICKSIFSITNSANKTHKEITILGMKIRIKRKKL